MPSTAAEPDSRPPLFLADPAGEAAFLWLLQETLDGVDGLATYNGSRFDLPLLRTRWVMASILSMPSV